MHLPSRSFAAIATLVALTAGAGHVAGGAVGAQAPAAFSPQEVIPFDSAVRTTTLANGLRVFIRQNAQPAKRVALRLAVKTGSIHEADDQRGLAHFVEHMAFNGSAHFKPGELISAFESVGARLGPHVNAYTSFDETVYMLELPSDQPDIVTRGLEAMADFAGGLTLDTGEIDKERGVVIEEWRGGLGAASRIRDKQLPVLFYRSRYAERLPIGDPDVIRNSPPQRLRDFYNTWYRPDRMAIIVVGDIDAGQIEQGVRSVFGPLSARAPEAAEPDRTVPLHEELLVSVATDPELTRSSVQLLRKHPTESNQRVADYRRGLLERLGDYMIGQRFSELARRPDAKFLGAGAGGSSLSQSVDAYIFSASVQDGQIPDGLSAVVVEANRVRQFGFGDLELDRAKQWMSGFMLRAYNEREKTESGSYAQEYVNYFLEGEPSPGVAYEYQLVQQLLPTITTVEISAFVAMRLGNDSRVLLATAPQKPGVPPLTEGDLRTTLAAADKTAVTPWSDTTVTRELVQNKPSPAAITSRREVPDVGITIVRFANGAEAWIKPTDFKNDQIVFDLMAPGGLSLASCGEFPEATLATSYVGLAGVGGLKALDLQRMLSGKLASASPYIALSSHGISGGAPPAQLETALQLLYLNFTAPNEDADAFAVLTRQMAAAVANRGQSPQQLFGDRLAEVNTSGHCTSIPLTAERVGSLDRSKMSAFYRARFANAADFTFVITGALQVDDVLPLLARYVGSLPSTGEQTSRFADIGVRFPDANQRAVVEKGREPRSQTVMSFFADPGPTPLEQEYALAAVTVLEIALRDALREELGQTYGVSVGLSQSLPQRGGGHVRVQFGAAPENVTAMTDRVLAEIKRLQADGPSADLTSRAKETARRTYETSLRENNYWLRRMSSIRLLNGNLADIVNRNERIESITPTILQEVFKKDFPLDRYTTVTLVPEPGK
ncbi:MAG TPA: insulinase family protein [Vicinamibacterales bacterium]|nr:insulinase family protein [Vicinamibacterales bacterium]